MFFHPRPHHPRPDPSLLALLILGFAALAVGRKPQDDRYLDVRGVRFEREVLVGSKRLPLRGATLCRHRTFKVYTAAFYVPLAAKTLKEVLGGDTPRRLVLHYHRDIERADIIEAAEQTLEDNPGVNLVRIRTRLSQIHSLFQDVSEGDRYTLDYSPGKGCELFFNGKSKGIIPGEDFAEAYFGIWLSDHSISAKYRNRLLGRD